MPADTAATVAQNAADAWTTRVRVYGNLVPDRVAQALAEAANGAEAQPEADVDSIVAAIDAKLEALRSSITRYAEPYWGAGNQGYGQALEASDVEIAWQLGADEDHCADCLGLASGSPYARGQIPTWPKAGDTACFDNCYCSIVADEKSWNKVFGGNDDDE